MIGLEFVSISYREGRSGEGLIEKVWTEDSVKALDAIEPQWTQSRMET